MKFLVKNFFNFYSPRAGSMDRRAAREPLRPEVLAGRRRRSFQASGPRWPERDHRRVPDQRVRSEAR